MSFNIVELIQGTPQWHEHRSNHFNASDAPAMMGCSPYKTRDQLLREMATGVSPEVDQLTQSRFDDGHRFEALARPLAEQYIGQTLYPVTGTNGKYSASLDGINDAEDVIFEHKTLGDSIRPCKSADDLPLHYRVQMEHQMMVSGAKKCLFMGSQWNDQDVCLETIHLWYFPDEPLRQQIMAGWDQFAEDLKNYQHIEPTIEVIGRAPESLPALRIEVTGMVTASNLEEFKKTALALIGSINRDLQTDEDFANADKAVKWCKEAEERLDSAKQHALSQTASIDELFRTIDQIKEEARVTRLELDKLVKGRKESIKIEILEAARASLVSHINALNKKIGKPYMPTIPADFAGAVKGKKSFATMRSAVNDELARAKISANMTADSIASNLNVMREMASDHMALFHDMAYIVRKPTDDLVSLIKARIADHAAEEQAKADAIAAKIKAEAQKKTADAQTATDAVVKKALDEQVTDSSSDIAAPDIVVGMTVDEALEFADEWSKGMTLYEGAQGWRVVCMLLAEEVRRVRLERVALADSIILTLDENSHLADGDMCTLKSLKDALLAVGIQWDGDHEQN